MAQIKLQYSPYQLQLLRGHSNAGSGSHIEGVLLKVFFTAQEFGYSCLQTWPQLGGSTLTESIQSLRTGDYTPEAKQALHLAEYEMQWRQSGRRLPAPRQASWEQHLLINDLQLVSEQYLQSHHVLKIKMNQNWQQSLPQLKEWAKAHFILRLDFNNSLSPSSFTDFLNNAQEILGQVEFIEDPFLADVQQWQKFSSQFSVSLAWDFQTESYPQQSGFVLIHKPLRNSLVARAPKTIFTSNMDHPVGQRLAFLQLLEGVQLQQLDFKVVHGLNSHLVMTPNAYSEQMGQGPTFQVWNETGVGFEKLLENEKWLTL